MQRQTRLPLKNIKDEGCAFSIMDFGIEQARAWITNANQAIQDNKEKLTDLDQAIGDGDHGLNMARGFQEVKKKIDESDYRELGTLFKDVAMTLQSKVGGASGPLYGSAFLKGSQYANEKERLSIEELGQFLREAGEAIKTRGKAQVGDKTMIDVWEYAPESLLNEKEHMDWEGWILLLHRKMENTSELEAKKGRAAYLGNRSVGYVDPGAVSSYLLLKALGDVFKA